jgi:4-hydroxyproline epimerase
MDRVRIVSNFVYYPGRVSSTSLATIGMTLNNHLPLRVKVVDSHTAGEPTRCVTSGGPDLGSGSLSERLARLRQEHDHFRRAVICEPRGSDVLVGALLVEPVDPQAAAGVIFFNNVGYLGMCGHGMIGVAATLKYLGRIEPGSYHVETPVGGVQILLGENSEVTIGNVDSYRYRTRVPVEVPGFGELHGDVAWGGNWFFLVEDHPFTLLVENVDELTAFAWQLRQALAANGICGANGAEIDHIELTSAPRNPINDSRNFVLCPGKVYDRSPCGTGTSAKLACLAADNKLKTGQRWRQEGILGSVFTGYFEREGERIIPHITSSAHVTAESSLIFLPEDPFRSGFPVPAGAEG